MRVTVWHAAAPPGPTPDEADSLVQAESVTAALLAVGITAGRRALDLGDLPGSLRGLVADRPDVVFNLVEETDSQAALNVLPAQLLEALRLPFTGAGSMALALTQHKVAAKGLLAAAGLPTPDWISATHERLVESDGTGLFLLKPVATDASQGLDEGALRLVAGTGTARRALEEIPPGPLGGWFAERYVDGREFNLSLIETESGLRVLAPAEMCFVDYPPDKPRVVGYRAKWAPDSFEYRHTVRRFALSAADRPLADELSALALACWRLFELRGYARVDFRVDAGGRPWVLEINPNPAIAPDAGFTAAATESGIPYPELVRSIAVAALRAGGLTPAARP